MSFTLGFQKGLRGEVDEAYRWYEGEREGLGEEFLAELDRVFVRISKKPTVHRMIWKDVRRALVKRFPYSVFYRVSPKRVEIVAVLCSRRDPGVWKSRVDGD